MRKEDQPAKAGLPVEAGVMFDIKPVDDSGFVDLAKISAVEPVINLAAVKKALPKKFAKNRPVHQAIQYSQKEPESILDKSLDPKEEFESALNENVDLHTTLANYGIESYEVIKPQKSFIAKKPEPEPELEPDLETERQPEPFEFDLILNEITRSRAALNKAPEMRPMVALEKPVPTADVLSAATTNYPKVSLVSKKSPRVKSKKSKKWFWIITTAVVIVILILLAGLRLKQHVTAQGQSAVAQLENAKADLQNMKFDNASQDFAKAYEDFSKASAGLNFLGTTVSNIISSLPGGSAVKSAQNLVKIGQLLSDSGGAMTQAAKALSNAGGLLTPNGVSINSVMTKLQKALAISAADISDIKALLAGTDTSIIPQDKKESFDQLSALVPTLENVVGKGADYAKFFADVSAQSGTHRYLLLFENSSELRPTGGFPGSYGVVTFQDGKLDNFFVDDVYNLDGQIKEPVVPPGPLQHITPDWGMRDANWFPDFPTSARVIEDFYKKESGNSVDGVITINPALVTDILKVVGPIQMPEYGLTLSADNFITTIQNQIEYVADRAQPKQVVKDFAPLLMAKLHTASSDQWLAMFNSLIASLDKKTVLMYFNNLNFETFADDQGFSGQLNRVAGIDYVMPTISNIKGSKTDVVTDTSFKLTTEFENNDAIHTLTITRTHNGGQNKYAFYNKQNPAYVRVLVPDGAELISIDGNDSPSFNPLLNYAKAGFVKNETLASWESSGSKDLSGMTTYKESGKTEFGFWLITNPQSTKVVTLTYRVPNVAKPSGSYNLYFQKQPGLIIKNADITAGDYSFNAPLEKDLSIKTHVSNK